jgi:hypothetical protein
MYCDRATSGSPCDDNFAGDAERIEKRNHVVTDNAKIDRAGHFFRHASTAHIGTQYRKIFGQERHQSVPALEAAAKFVEQDQGLRAIAGKGVADCSAVDFGEGCLAHDLVSSAWNADVQVCTEIWRFAAIVVSRWDEGIFHAESEPEHYRFGVGGQSFAR